MLNRREFVKRVAAPAFVLPVFSPSLPETLETLRVWPGTASEIARDEEFWLQVQQAFTVDRSLVNLNNGGVSPSPAIVQESMKKHLDFSNQSHTVTTMLAHGYRSSEAA